MAPTSFGLTAEYKFEVHKAMMITAHYSKGAFSVMDLYNMPVYLRNFYMKQFGELKKKENEQLTNRMSNK